MTIPATLRTIGITPDFSGVTLLCLFVFSLIFALRQFPWRNFRQEYPEWRHHVFFASLTVLGVFWSIQAAITPGLELHFLLLAVFTLMFWWPTAVIGVVIVNLVLALLDIIPWHAVVPRSVIWGFIPVFFTSALHRFLQRKYSHNIFIYIFITGFWGAAASLGLAALSWAAWLSLQGAVPPEKIFQEFLSVVPLLFFGEGFLNGAALTLMVVYRPHWVRSFSDKFYLSGKKRF